MSSLVSLGAASVFKISCEKVRQTAVKTRLLRLPSTSVTRKIL